jgi:hypothetical protein
MRFANRYYYALIFLVASQLLNAQTQGQADPEALASAEAFIDLLDEGQWQEAYDSGAFTFDFSLFEEVIVKHRSERGALVSRTFAKVIPKLGGMPGDEIRKKTELVFESVFDDGPWMESVALVTQGGGPWLAEGYSIGPKQPE